MNPSNKSKNHPLWDHYESPVKSIRQYFKAYGGWKALFFSPFLHSAFFVTCLSMPWGLNHPWWDRVLGVLPNLLGFTLSGFALLLALGGESHQTLLAKAGGRGGSVLRKMSTAYVHFIIVQSAALMWAWSYEGMRVAVTYVANNVNEYLQLGPHVIKQCLKFFGTFVGMLLGYYSIFCAFALVLRAFHQVEQFIEITHRRAAAAAELEAIKAESNQEGQGSNTSGP